MKRALLLLLCLLPAAAPGLAGDRSEQDSVREAVARGEALPLSRILPEIEARFGGRVLDVEFERGDEGDDEGDGGRYIYEFEVLSGEGRLFEIEVDAATGRILEVEEDD